MEDLSYLSSPDATRMNALNIFPVRHRSPKADVLYDSGGGGTVYDPPPKERKDENAGIIIENSEMAD